MGIPLYRGETVDSGKYIDCFHCVEICPRKNISANPAPAVATLVTVGALTGLYYLGNLTAGAASGSLTASPSSETVLSENQESSEAGQFTDGVYTGNARGFRGDTEVSVTVENGSIAKIEVLSYEDDQEFFNRAKDTVITEILAVQSADVDVVSGATFSSESIIGTVANALTSAGTDTKAGSEAIAQEDTDGSTSAEASEETGGASSGSAALNVGDGVYTGSGTGFRGTTSVSVTVSGGIITGISVESYQDDEQFFSRAEDTIIFKILSAQSVDVDAMSGATFSSNGILEAVADALSLDFTNSNNSAQKGGHGGHGGHDLQRG
ncbi:hypothetical protein OBV_07240 [Oscillibacter valericigenes Sjm18-20]|nr:hypothetical protein OBV_07240 [Oscillibacter valericigenes Sjm18-20]